jgi:hypothetical protein
MAAITGAHERRREQQLRQAIGNRLARGERTLAAADLAADLGADEWTVEYLLRRACRVRGLTVVEREAQGRLIWEVM